MRTYHSYHPPYRVGLLTYVLYIIYLMSSFKRGARQVFGPENQVAPGADRGSGKYSPRGFQYIRNRPKPVTDLHQKGVIWTEV